VASDAVTLAAIPAPRDLCWTAHGTEPNTWFRSKFRCLPHGEPGGWSDHDARSSRKWKKQSDAARCN
jgi:hypothetical protein